MNTRPTAKVTETLTQDVSNMTSPHSMTNKDRDIDVKDTSLCMNKEEVLSQLAKTETSPECEPSMSPVMPEK